MIAKLGPRRYAAEGSPADCVLAGLYDVLAETPPDLVLSGVNRGNNAAENALYSGTLGGAIEAALQDVPAIALSQYYGPRIAGAEDPFSAARAHGVGVVRDILGNAVWQAGEYLTFFNVNFPPVPAEEVKGVRVARQGRRPTTRHKVAPATAPSGRRFLWVTGGPQDEPTGAGTDAQANLDGYVAVTPMQADFPAHAMLGPLATALDREV